MPRTRDAAVVFLASAFLRLLVLAHATIVPVPATLVVPGAGAGPDDPRCRPVAPRRGALPVYPSDMEQLQFLLNAKYVEAEWFLHGVDFLDRNISGGGPRPVGARKADLDFRTTEIAAELGYQELGHIRAIKQYVGGFPRPAIDLSADRFAMVMDDAMGARLDPPFDPYANSVNFLLASYVLPHVTAAATMGISSTLMGYLSKRLQASILAVEAGQDAVIRLLLYQRADEVVAPYQGHTVADFTRRISDWRNRLSGCGAKDEGVKVLDHQQHPRRRRGLARVPAHAGRGAPHPLRLPQGRNEQIPGGFLPRGANGTIARGFFQLA